MTEPAPGPAPDRSPSEAYLRQRLVGAGDTVEVQSGAVEAVLAELDRVRAGVQAAGQDQAAAIVRDFLTYAKQRRVFLTTDMPRCDQPYVDATVTSFLEDRAHWARLAARSAPAIPEPETSESIPAPTAPPEENDRG